MPVALENRKPITPTTTTIDNTIGIQLDNANPNKSINNPVTPSIPACKIAVELAFIFFALTRPTIIFYIYKSRN